MKGLINKATLACISISVLAGCTVVNQNASNATNVNQPVPSQNQSTGDSAQNNSSPSPSNNTPSTPVSTPSAATLPSDEELKGVINALLEVSNSEDIERYASLLHENSPNYSLQLESTRQNFALTNWRYEILEITVTEKFETEAKVFAKLRVTDLDSGESDRAEVLYTLRKSANQWKIFTFENKSFGV